MKKVWQVLFIYSFFTSNFHISLSLSLSLPLILCSIQFLHLKCVAIIFLFRFFLKEFQLMTFAPDDNSFIIRPWHQLVFGVGRDWTLNLLFNHKKLYQLSSLEPTFQNFFWIEFQPMAISDNCALCYQTKTPIGC